ncbi:MAG: class I SAM-dependent methyltransferase [Pirellulales bacterium]|nr:class I SAM-dependent methyltransferase [Pirellulales bacterium]
MSDVIPSRSLRSDLRVLWHLLVHPVRGRTHAERLENFYRGQAEHYDSFRARMLHGRGELIAGLELPAGGVWVDMGAGTGENVMLAGDDAKRLDEIHLVDLSASLLEVAAQRLEQAELASAQCHLADATCFQRPPASVDLVTFSYSLTMIPDWFEALTLAERMLKPGGTIAVTDFYISRKFAGDQLRQHGWLRRTFWALWFAADNVFLSADHLALLRRRFQTIHLEEKAGKVPYLPLARAPYYVFIGRKPAGPGA